MSQQQKEDDDDEDEDDEEDERRRGRRREGQVASRCMRYTPHTAADQERMLRAIGLDSIEDLYRHVPKSLRERRQDRSSRRA